MPHKRNPVAAMLALQAGLRAPGLVSTLLAQQAGEHERGLGTWPYDWWTLGALFECAGSATQAIGEALEGLVVVPGAMQANLLRTQGFVHAEAVTVALSLALGKAAAHAQMEQLCRQAIEAGRTLRDALIAARRQDAVLANALPDALLETLFDPSAQQGDAQTMIDHTLAAWRGL